MYFHLLRDSVCFLHECEVLCEFFENFLLLLGPTVKCDFVALQAQPFEHARLGSGAWDERADQFPALPMVLHFCHRNSVPFTVLADEPDQNLEVTHAPVALEFAGFSHPVLPMSYFSMRFSASPTTVS